MRTFANEKERNKYFEAAYLHGSGFCGTCGEGIRPKPEDLELFGKCPFDGSHPSLASQKQG